MRELNMNEVMDVTGGLDLGQIGVGLGAIGLGTGCNPPPAPDRAVPKR